jgi:histone H3/H4
MADKEEAGLPKGARAAQPTTSASVCVLFDALRVCGCTCVGRTALQTATINKLLAEVIPSDLKLSAEVRDIFTDCCTGVCVRARRRRRCACATAGSADRALRAAEFVNLLSSEANELCDKEKKTTIGPEHVMSAMEARAHAARRARRAPHARTDARHFMLCVFRRWGFLRIAER